ncbi:glutaminase A [Gilvimarinus sp. DA14]|uniref:glutaminase A n=1 Tax=Gilvimarinus sp. DA14 TaxID=2956798 RepID=UPI0020B8FB9C|nr:glutaminase A [Gilvimarinus sp. DA14]UTF59740.1 glutaminase A [Gilvimarinus sp. DA14]
MKYFIGFRKGSVMLGLLLIGLLNGALTSAADLSDNNIKQALRDAYQKYRGLDEGENADYIPALAEVDSSIYGIVLVTAGGKVYTEGDVKSEVSIQSISKVFTMALVMDQDGTQELVQNMGVDATGQVFNSIVAIEQYQGAEMNPLVNAGAIATTGLVDGKDYDEIWGKIAREYNEFAGRELEVLEDVYQSEAATNQRNRAIASLMHAYGHIDENFLRATDIYTRQCSVGVNAKDLGVMAATLANAGKNPVTNKQVTSAENVPEILAVMATAGLYDDAGKWLYKTGLPAKSGVGGGIIAVSPGKFGIAVISPRLDAAGNSVRAQKAIADISNALGGNPYEVTPR